MDGKQLARALGQQVRLRDGVYILTGIILRRSESGFFYQAELTRGNAILVANPLCVELIEEVQGNG
jgi:hypothetical protein